MLKPAGIERISFLTPGNFAEDDPAGGLEDALRLFELGERLGFDGAWVRQRHLECSVSSAATFLAAATQRTRRIELGAAVIQMGYETPFRLAEDLATVDVLSTGRLQVGLSAGKPALAALLGDRFGDGDPALADHARIERLVASLSGDFLGDEAARVVSAAGSLRPRIRPVAAGLAGRLWYGAGSSRSVEWAARNGFNLLVGNINVAEAETGFTATQLRHLAAFRALSTKGSRARIAVGRVILPLNGADGATRGRYRTFAAERHARTLEPQGERRTQFAPDLVAGVDEIVATLLDDPVLAQVEELRLELPYNLPFDDYAQILHDFAYQVAPFLGWHGPPGYRGDDGRRGNVTPLRRQT